MQTQVTKKIDFTGKGFLAWLLSKNLTRWVKLVWRKIYVQDTYRIT
jgi:hypothetical protein